eukprot:TRINITY_DN4310_c0_g1_i1.p1 TRINITY_DN4310_c0_g1~~TRINITY_DN4310_c0_g1_i1.p1  ORF type:complete len:135 (-),score=39.95 TRINITY_DN4310_c0_g1_i1:240-644(-)
MLATVSGWGTLQAGGFQPVQLMEVNVTTMDNTECGAFYAGYEDITDSMICASGEGKDSCQGDSGGPLVTLESSSFYSLIGVVSWGYGTVLVQTFLEFTPELHKIWSSSEITWGKYMSSFRIVTHFKQSLNKLWT